MNAIQKSVHGSTKIIHDAFINNPKGSTYVHNLQLFQNTIHIKIIFYLYYRMYYIYGSVVQP